MAPRAKPLVLLCGLAALAAAPWPAAAGADRGAAARASAADGGSEAPDGGRVERDGAPARDPDQDVIDHLEELQQLELLEHLGLVDESGEDEAPPTPRRADGSGPR